jgi:hypothetical protein
MSISYSVAAEAAGEVARSDASGTMPHPRRDPAFEAHGRRVQQAGPDAVVRAFHEIQRRCPASSAAVVEVVAALGSWPTGFLREVSRIVDPVELLREVGP